MISRRALLTSALAAGCAHGRGGPYASWVVIRTEGFDVYSDTSGGTAQQIAHEIEAISRALKTAFFPTTTLPRQEVLLFADQQDQQDVVEDTEVPAVRREARPLVLHARTSRRRGESGSPYTTLPEREAAVELFRRMLAQNMRRVPPWFRIGAEHYVETVSIEGSQARFGHRMPRPTAELAAGRFIPLEQLLAARNADFHRGDWERSHRASAWAFVHYLLGAEKGTLRPRFDAIARALVEANRPGPAESRAAITAAFPEIDWPTLEGRVRDYAVVQLGQRNFFHPMIVTFPAPPPADYPTAPADQQRLVALLAGLKH